MRKRIGGVIIGLILLCSVTALSACDIGMRYDDKTVVDGVALCSNKLHKKSLAAYCEWNGDMSDTVFTVPDEYNGYKVKCLGEKGNIGFTGNPGSFGVHIPEKIGDYNSITRYSTQPKECGIDTVDLSFTVNIGRYVDELEKVNRQSFYEYGIESAEGDTVKVIYRVTINYVIDSDNSTFYSRDGDIYYKSNDQKIEYRG